MKKKQRSKLPKERVHELVNSGRAERFDPGHGSFVKEWVAFKSEESKWVSLAREAYNFFKKGKP